MTTANSDGSYVFYSANNSGGSWWLSDDNWRALEAAGWSVNWAAEWPEDQRRFLGEDGRYMGALARSARYPGADLRAAIKSWESATGLASNALGCQCCGTPHDFTVFDADDNYVDSYSPSYPSYGDEY